MVVTAVAHRDEREADRPDRHYRDAVRRQSRRPGRLAVNGSVTVTVGKAATTTAVTANQQGLTATVRPVAPGAGQPTGTVTFSLGPFTIGTAAVGANGVATLNTGNRGMTLPFTATYSGDGHFAGSSGTKRIGL